MTHDISNDKQALQNMLNNLPGLAYRCSNDSNWTMEYVSAGSVELTGYCPQDLLYNRKTSFEQIIHEDDRVRVRQAVDEAVEGGNVFEVTYRILTKSGVYKWVWEQGRLIDGETDGQTLEGFITDVTALKQEEHARIESQKRNALILETAMSSIITVNSQGTIESVNPAAERTFGYTSAEMIGTPVQQLLPLFEDSPVPEFTREHPDPQRDKGIRKGGKVFPVDFSIGEAPLDTGSIFTLIIRDITEHASSEKALRRSEQRYRSLVTAGSAIICTTGPDGSFRTRQQAWEQYTGQTWEEHQGWGWANATHEDDSERIQKEWYEALTKKEPYYTKGRLFCRKAGDYHYCESTLVPIIRDDGTIREWIGTTMDIHEQYLAEEELRENEERFALAFKASNDCLWDMNLETGIIKFNEAFEVKFADEVVQEGTNPLDWWKERVLPADSKRILKEYLENAGNPEIDLWDCQYKFRTAEGPYAAVSARCVFKRNAEGKAIRVVGTLVDISKRREIEEAVLKGCEEVYRRVGHDIHDDLCQELFGIKCLAHSLANELETAGLSQESQRAVVIEKMVQELTHRAREIAHGLAPVSLDSEGLVGALEHLARRVQLAHEVDCEVHHDGADQNCDKNIVMQMYRIAQEAIKNAIQHGEADKISIHLTRQNTHWLLTISDNGCGIPENRSHGMGMETMNYRANTIDASIAFENQITGGTRVHCTIPFPSTEDEQT